MIENRGLAYGIAAGLLYVATALGGQKSLEQRAQENIVRGPINIEYKLETNNIEKISSEQKEISNEGIKLITSFEGFKSKKYFCPAGKPTIAYGHLIKPNEYLTKVTKSQGEVLLEADLVQREKAVERLVKVDLSQPQYDALISLVYNIGEGNFAKSDLLRKLNSADYHGAAKEFDKYVKARDPKTGKLRTLKGLVKRRNAEEAMFIGR